MSDNSAMWIRADALMPGGVNSPVRAFKAVGGEPLMVDRAEGAYIYDTDGKAYVDYVGAFGPAILGQAHAEVVDVVQQAAAKGFSYGATCEGELALAEKITSLMPAIEQVRLVNSGTEACMSVLRLARAATGRQKILKFIGGYHGHVDAMLVAAGSGAATLGVPSSPGVPAAVAQHTLLAEYNDLAAVDALCAEHPDDLAAIIVEPVAGNMNCVLPQPGFLQGLRDACDRCGALLIVDEVMTGFRVAAGGACERFGLTPDLVMLGKIIGGGMPVGAFGGRRDLMQMMAPVGPVYQAGTLSGSPLAVAAGLATLNIISRNADFYAEMEARVCRLLSGLEERANSADVPFSSVQAGSMFGWFLHDRCPNNYAEASQGADTEHFARVYHAMLQQGVFWAPSVYEAAFMSAAHDDDALETTWRAAEVAFRV